MDVPTANGSGHATQVTAPIQNNHHSTAARESTRAGISEISMNGSGHEVANRTDVGSDEAQKIVEVDVAKTENIGEDEESFETTVNGKSWFLSIQEEKKENPRYKTKYGYWPSLWKMAGTFVDDFKKADFYKTQKNSNLADFKIQIVQHILSLCNNVSKNEIPEKYLFAIRTGNGNLYKK